MGVFIRYSSSHDSRHSLVFWYLVHQLNLSTLSFHSSVLKKYSLRILIVDTIDFLRNV
jgi:hypothetical protein